MKSRKETEQIAIIVDIFHATQNKSIFSFI